MTYLARHLPTGCGCDEPAAISGLVSIDEAYRRVSRHVPPISSAETLDLVEAKGRVLATPVRARADMPRFDHAAMDGFAVNSGAFVGTGPWLFPVRGRVAAGDDPNARCASTDACRIFTGAPLPDPFDCVVMQERAERRGDMIRLTTRPEAGQNVRRRAEEYPAGAEIVTSGTVLTPRAIAACASAGQWTVGVKRRVRVALIATGSEVAAPGAADLRAGQIWDVNTPMLQSLLSRPDVDLQDVITVKDSHRGIRDAILSAAGDADLVITTGGVSVGDEDHLHAAFHAAGGAGIFAGVAIKPGKPVALGRIGDATWLGLPGNPGAAFVTCTIFGELVLNTLAGRCEAYAKRRHVILGHDLSRKAGRCEIRAARVIGFDTLGRDVIDCRSVKTSGRVCHYAGADGLAFLPAEMDRMPTGALVELLPFCTN